MSEGKTTTKLTEDDKPVPMEFEISWDPIYNDHLLGVVSRKQVNPDGIPAQGTIYNAPTIKEDDTRSVIVRSIGGGKRAEPFKLKVEPNF